MDNLRLEKANNTPYVSLDASTGLLELSGRSIPENPGAFYDPIYAWLNQYFENPFTKIEVNFKFEYINSGSSKCILEILRIILNRNTDISKLQINWFYEKEDESILELGEHYKSIFELPFSLIAV